MEYQPSADKRVLLLPSQPGCLPVFSLSERRPGTPTAVTLQVGCAEPDPQGGGGRRAQGEPPESPVSARGSPVPGKSVVCCTDRLPRRSDRVRHVGGRGTRGRARACAQGAAPCGREEPLWARAGGSAGARLLRWLPLSRGHEPQTTELGTHYGDLAGSLQVGRSPRAVEGAGQGRSAALRLDGARRPSCSICLFLWCVVPSGPFSAGCLQDYVLSLRVYLILLAGGTSACLPSPGGLGPLRPLNL